MKRKNTEAKFKRLHPGYYYTTQPVTIDGTETHVVIEESEGGSFWILRLEFSPGMATTHQTKRHATFALNEMITADSFELALA